MALHHAGKKSLVKHFDHRGEQPAQLVVPFMQGLVEEKNPN
jgi:hypothetical protein